MTESDDFLRHMADEHVCYELRGVVMLAAVGNIVPLDQAAVRPELRPLLGEWVTSSLLEAGLVHVRCVVEFLTGAVPAADGPRATDVVAAHYLSGARERYVDHVLGTSRRHQRELLEDVHRRVMHLTSQRATVVSDGPFVWCDYIVEQVPAVLGAFRGFLDELAGLSPERFAWFSRSNEILASVGLPSRTT